ncbi:hypothetical protein H2Y57_00610 [Pectobacterium aroidearum]|uniref:DUF4760 domain-containing protein n=1 Tax=Pectobacterium aroidearum TaxID=1201031 RepID=A0AAW3SMY2_9GAMM|nr:hypothetical protein [Pectobacterium aroidearum]MBA5202204.1 hypothetical protein [Pectobacterium aroidearum]
MDVDIISYETLLATRDSANWVMWGAIATGVTAVSSVFTLFYAIAALNTWKKQEKTKIKSEFKRSLLALEYAIHMMPNNWDTSMVQEMHIEMAARTHTLQNYEEIVVAQSDLKKCWHDATSAWVMCEGLLKKTNLTRLWEELSNIYIKYLSGRINKKVILDKLAEMHSIEFIFD